METPHNVAQLWSRPQKYLMRQIWNKKKEALLLSAHTFVIWKFSKIRNKKIHFHRWPYAFVCVRDSLPAGDTYRPWITQSPADDNDYRITDVSNFTRISPPPYSRDTCIRHHFDPIEGVTRRNSGRRTDRGVIRSTQCERAASEWPKRRSRGLPESGFVERENRTLCWSQSFRVGAAERPVETRASVPLIHSPPRLLRENCKKKIEMTRPPRPSLPAITHKPRGDPPDRQ